MDIKFVYNSETESIAAKARAAETNFELANVCERLNVADKIYLGQTDLWLAKLSLSAVYRTLKHYSALRNYLNYFGVLDGFISVSKEVLPVHFTNGIFFQRILRKETDNIVVQCEKIFASEGLASAFCLRCGEESYSGILINEKKLNQQTIIKNLEYGEKVGHSPRGCNSVKSIMEHEIGHLFDFMLQVSTSKEYRHFIKTVTADQVYNELSHYAVHNGLILDREVVAEAYSEYHNNPQPRAIASFIGSLIDKMYRTAYGFIS